MTDRNISNALHKDNNFAEILRNSIMVILTLIFVFLYAAAFSGKLDPLKDNTMILRFEPLIFLFIGYYFGWLLTRKNEQTLKEEITRQSQKADAAQYAKEQAQQEREALEEKIKNARTALKMSVSTKSNANEMPGAVNLKAVLGILES